MARIPPHARQVFTGKVFDIYQWEQEMFDGSREIFEMAKRVDGVKVIAVTEEQKVIVLRESQPWKGEFLGMPGGNLEISEDALSWAKRELLEETGYTSNDWELYRTTSRWFRVESDFHLFIARNARRVSDSQSLDSGERIEVELYDFDQFVEEVLAEKIRFQDITYLVMREKLADPTLVEFRKKLLGN